MDAVLSSLFMIKRSSAKDPSYTLDGKLKFCNEKEAKNYTQLKQHINDKKFVTKTDITNMIVHVLKDRERFNESKGRIN